MAEETRNLTQAQEEEQLAEQARIRREKLAKLSAKGITRTKKPVTR